MTEMFIATDDNLQGLTDDELIELSNKALELVKTRKQAGKNEELKVAIDKYSEKNELGKRIYNLTEVSKITGVSTTRLKKALKEVA